MSQYINWNILFTPSPSWAHLVCCSEHEIDSINQYNVPAAVGAVVRTLRSVRCSTSQELFSEWAAALQFPYYFGHNWDAFDECITDLEWMPANAYILVVTQADRLLNMEERDLPILLGILSDASAAWAHQQQNDVGLIRTAKPFHVIFHCEPPNEVETRRRLEVAGTMLPMCLYFRYQDILRYTSIHA